MKRLTSMGLIALRVALTLLPVLRLWFCRRLDYRIATESNIRDQIADAHAKGFGDTE